MNPIKRFMRTAAANHLDRRTGEVCSTTLAEDAAEAFDCHARLDDDTDPIWDWALDAAELYERERAIDNADAVRDRARDHGWTS